MMLAFIIAASLAFIGISMSACLVAAAFLDAAKAINGESDDTSMTDMIDAAAERRDERMMLGRWG